MSVLMKVSYSFDPIDVKKLVSTSFQEKLSTEIQMAESICGAHI